MEQAAQIEAERQWCAQNYAPLPVVLARGHGVWVWDTDNRRYLDMMSAYSAVSHGHGHPRLLAALCEQASQLVIPSRAFHHDQMFPFLERLCELTGQDRALLMNTGAEAVETAIKAARRWGYEVKGIPDNKAEIIVANDNFHGRTVTITSFSTEAAYRHHFGPFTPGFVPVPFGDAKALEAAITPNTCAVLVEPMQGEAGIKIPPVGWLTRIAEVCENSRVLLILDEIQTGLGRTGARFAHDHESVKPDGLILGKALGGGMFPVSAFLSRADVMDVFQPGTHGSTFGGNPLACRVGLEALNVMEAEGFTERSRELGAYFYDQLTFLEHPAIRAVRGKGLWLGLELDPSRLPPRQLCEALLNLGVLAKDVHDTVVRFAPPLVIERSEIDGCLDALKHALSAHP